MRALTADAHARLDRAVMALGAFDSLDGYRCYLAGQYAFRAAVEAVLGRAGPGRVLHWPNEPLAALIGEDLSDLAVQHPAARPDIEAILDIALASAEPGIANRARCLGLAYVIEGSRLGAQVLWRRAQALGLSDAHGARHLARQVATRGPWQAVIAALETLEPSDEVAAAVAARATFRAAECAFDAGSDAR